MQDRVPQYPGRVKMTPVAGQANVFDMVRQDSPVAVGTPLDKNSLLKDTTAALFSLGASAVPDDALSQLATKIIADIRTYPIAAGQSIVAKDTVHINNGQVMKKLPVGDLPLGHIVQLNFDGKLEDFLIVQKGKPSAIYSSTFDGTTTLLRRNSADVRLWTPTTNDYSTSSIHTALNGEFYNRFDAATKAAIKQVKVPYRPGSGSSMVVSSGENGLATKLWLPSGYEMGASPRNYLPADGAPFAYVPKIDGLELSTQYGTFLRSPYATSGTASVWALSYQGAPEVAALWQVSKSILFAVTLPNSFPVSDDSSTPNAIALQSGTSGQSIRVILSGVASLPGINAGEVITSAGVRGYSTSDGWISVLSKSALGNNDIVYGRFTGAYQQVQFINLGFEPRFVFLLSPPGRSIYLYTPDGYILAKNYSVNGDVSISGEFKSQLYAKGFLTPSLSSEIPYMYLAFR